MAKNGLEIVASLNVNSTEVEIQKGLNEISTRLQAKQIPKFVAQLDVTRTREIIQTQLNSLSNLNVNVGVNATNAIPNLNISDSVSQATSSFAVLEQKWKEQGILTGEFKTKVEQLKASLTAIGTTEGLNKYKADLAILTNEAKNFNAQIGNGGGTNKQAENIERLRTKIQKLIFDINAYRDANSRAMSSNIVSANGNTVAQNLTTMENQARQALNDLNDPTKLNQVNSQVRNLSGSFGAVRSEVRALDKTGNNFFENVWAKAKKFAGWMGLTTLISGSIRQLKNLVTSVREIDTAMVSLKKVTNATDVEYSNFLNNAKESAKDLGVAISDLIDATAEFSRLGYNLPDSEELGKVATLYKNVGDGITSEEASQSIISTMKAYGYEADKAIEIIDKFNQVGNNFSISSAGIGEALQRSASSLAEANNDLSQSIALQVGANNVIQNPEVVGNMWKTVAMRIRSAKTELENAGEDTEGMVESTAQLRDIVKGMTGFDIMKDEDTFKSTYDIILGIGNEWNKLTDLNQASLLEKLAGKRQGNALAAALNNIDDIKAAYESAENSAGSAMKEQEAYEKGIQYSLDKLLAIKQQLATTVIDSSFVKGFVDGLSNILSILDKIIDNVGLLPTLLVPIMGIMGAKNAGRDILISSRMCPTYTCGNTERVCIKMVI